MSVSVTTRDGKLRVTADYNEGFRAAAHRLAGKWVDGAWQFDARNAAWVRQALRDWYGTDGRSVPDTVSVRVRFDAGEYRRCAPFTLAGRIIAQALGRDSGAELGEGVVLVVGSFTSGGSTKNWCTEVGSSGAEVVLHDIPREAYERLLEGGEAQVSIEPPPKPFDVAELQAERARLLARIAEIDAELKDA